MENTSTSQHYVFIRPYVKSAVRPRTTHISLNVIQRYQRQWLSLEGQIGIVGHSERPMSVHNGYFRNPSFLDPRMQQDFVANILASLNLCCQGMFMKMFNQICACLHNMALRAAQEGCRGVDVELEIIAITVDTLSEAGMLDQATRESFDARPAPRTPPITALPAEAWDGTGSNNSEGCSICLESFDRGTMVTRLPCLHPFHKVCIEQWLNESHTCPLCRSKIS